MANKTQLGIGAVIAILVATYFGMGTEQNKNQTSTVPEQNADSSRQQHSNQQNPNQQGSNQSYSNQDHSNQGVETQSSQNRHGLDVIQKAFQSKLSNVQVQSEGRVKAILRDDNEGSRHQKFILSLENGLTILVAHNIDLSPRIENLRKGDTVEFFGEYEYSAQGGVIHWTHHDPQGRHEDGWLKHDGKTYQ